MFFKDNTIFGVYKLQMLISGDSPQFCELLVLQLAGFKTNILEHTHMKSGVQKDGSGKYCKTESNLWTEPAVNKFLFFDSRIFPRWKYVCKLDLSDVV